LSVLAVATGLLAAAVPAAASSSVPLGHGCIAQNGVRFCPTADLASRVPSFDGVPLDVDVTLPEKGKGPFPTIVMLHGFGGSKTDFETASAAGPAPDQAGGGATIYRYNNVFYAKRGYAVVNYTARGFGNSCGGGLAGDHSGACGNGYIRLADSRYEVRDTQYLLGLLADEGVTRPRQIGVTGISYGGGQAMELAFLADKIRKPDGKLAAWRSPHGKKLRIAAAYPRWPWSDLVSALIPNGRFLDTEVAPREQSLEPFGVPISSYLNGLYLSGVLSGYYCGGAPASTPCTDSQANVTQDKALIDAGQPLSAEATAALKGVYLHNGAYAIRFLKGAPRPAPLLVQSGWTDELFPPEQALRVYAYLRSKNRRAPVSLQLGDLGHSRGSNKPGLNHLFNNQAAKFFAAHLLGARKGRPAPGSVTAFTQTCPITAPDGGPFRAKGWNALHPGSFGFGSSAAQEFTSSGGDANVAKSFDPVFGTQEACKAIPITAEPNVATYSRPVKRGFTLLGLPRVSGRISSTGQFGQIVARLWDLSPEGTQLLVSRGVYALSNGQSGKLEFELHGNGYRFGKGHTVQLELLARDAPYYQAGNFPFSVRASGVRVSLPTAQRKPR
jgi:predicted acyl esterase